MILLTLSLNLWCRQANKFRLRLWKYSGNGTSNAGWLLNVFLLSYHLTAPCQRRYGDAGEDSSHSGRPRLHSGKRGKGEFVDQAVLMSSLSARTASGCCGFYQAPQSKQTSGLRKKTSFNLVVLHMMQSFKKSIPLRSRELICLCWYSSFHFISQCFQIILEAVTDHGGNDNIKAREKGAKPKEGIPVECLCPADCSPPA